MEAAFETRLAEAHPSVNLNLVVAGVGVNVGDAATGAAANVNSGAVHMGFHIMSYREAGTTATATPGGTLTVCHSWLSTMVPLTSKLEKAGPPVRGIPFTRS